jgi:hypothetical protein
MPLSRALSAPETDDPLLKFHMGASVVIRGRNGT